MKFVCANCGQKFKVADDTKAAFKFTCTSCGTTFKANIAEEPIILPLSSPEKTQPMIPIKTPANPKMKLPNGKEQLKANFMADLNKQAQSKSKSPDKKKQS